MHLAPKYKYKYKYIFDWCKSKGCVWHNGLKMGNENDK